LGRRYHPSKEYNIPPSPNEINSAEAKLHLFSANLADQNFLDFFLARQYLPKCHALEFEPATKAASLLCASPAMRGTAAIRAFCHFARKKAPAFRADLLAIDRHQADLTQIFHFAQKAI
jgi:hypothetical protein